MKVYTEVIKQQMQDNIDTFVELHEAYEDAAWEREREQVMREMSTSIIEVKLQTTRPATFRAKDSKQYSLLHGDETQITPIFVTAIGGPHIEYHVDIVEYATHYEVGDAHIVGRSGRDMHKQRLVNAEHKAIQWVAIDWADAML